MRTFASVVACALLAGACDDSGAGPGSDAGTDGEVLPVYECWPDLAPVERGSVTLGAGGGQGYREMPDSLPLEYGFQGGFMVKTWPRMSGFLPGKAPITSPTNPFTRIHATLIGTDAALQLPGNCGSREWFVPNAVDSYDYNYEFAVVFNTCWGSDKLIGAQIQLDVELMDATGSHATNRYVITATEPLGEYPVGVTDPVCGT